MPSDSASNAHRGWVPRWRLYTSSGGEPHRARRHWPAQHEAAMFCEDEWLTLLDVEINGLADRQPHSRRLEAAFVRSLSGSSSWVCRSFSISRGTRRLTAHGSGRSSRTPVPIRCFTTSSRPTKGAKRESGQAQRCQAGGPLFRVCQRGAVRRSHPLFCHAIRSGEFPVGPL